MRTNLVTEAQSSREAILALRQVVEKQNRKIKTTLIAFVSLEKNFRQFETETIRAEVTYNDNKG